MRKLVALVVVALVAGAAVYVLTDGSDEAPAPAASSAGPGPVASSTTPSLKDAQGLAGMALAAGAARVDGQDLVLGCDAAPTYAVPVGATTLTARVEAEGMASVTVFAAKGLTATQVGFAAVREGVTGELVADVDGAATVQLQVTCSGATGVRVVGPAVGH